MSRLPPLRPGTYWSKTMMYSVFNFIDQYHPLYHEIEDILILQVGLKPSTASEYLNNWADRDWLYEDDNKRYSVRAGVIDMIKSSIPQHIIKDEKNKAKKEKNPQIIESEENPKKEYEKYMYRMNKKGSTDKILPYDEWLKTKNELKNDVSEVDGKNENIRQN